jgi:uncharacterized protein (DUF488 family)
VASAIFTVGHSNLRLEDFLALLERHAIERLADVRAFPASRRHPHFAREALAAACAARGIEYRWLPALGGRRRPAPASPHLAWREPGFRAYADYMDTAEFRAARGELEALAAEARTAFLCAEALWWQCHRRLIADSLLVSGWDVEHISSTARLEPHRLPDFARVEGERLIYDRGVTSGLQLEPVEHPVRPARRSAAGPAKPRVKR